jgi:tetratricopeptide (TPR) repeat protein
MGRHRIIFVSVLLGAWISSAPRELRAQNAPTQREEFATPNAGIPRDLADLELAAGRQKDLRDALGEKDYKRAETILTEEAARDPKSARAAKLLVTAGGIFFLDGQFLNSAIAWKKAEAIAPLDERSRFTLAMAYVKLNRRDWARSELDRLWAARPDRQLYLYWLGRLDYDEQQYTSAISRLERVVVLDPTMMRAFDLLGLCYDYLGRLDDAIKNYNQAVELNRRQAKPFAWPLVDLAISLLEVNQPAEAERNLREAIRYDAKLPQAQYQLGRVLEMRQAYPEATDLLKQAATLDPAYPEPHYLLGRIYQKKGESEAAKTEIARFQELKRARETGPTTKPSPSASQPPD